MSSKIPLHKKLKVYEAQVVSVIMYNASCGAAPAAVLEKLDICHRKHLRAIMNIRYPSIISNKTLYILAGSPFFERKSSKNQILVNVLM